MVTMLSYVGRRKNNTAFGFNPDVAFSYIDQKLQDVLGHFQKDFEREISADNLGPKYGQYGSFLPVRLRNPLTQSQPKSLVSVHSSNIPKLLKKFENMDSSTTKNTLPVHEKKSLKIRLKIGAGKAPKSNSASFSSLDFKNCPSAPIESILENKDENYEPPSSIVQAKALPVIPANTSLSLASNSFCLEEKDDPSTRNSKTRIDYCETKLLKQPTRDSKRIGPSPAFEGDSFILEKEIHKQYMKLKLSKRCRKGNKKCNFQDCSNISKKRKQCSASVAESNLNESTMENNGVFSSARTSTKLFGEMQGKSSITKKRKECSSTKLFGEMQGKSSITKKRKECSASAGESDLNENPTENGGVSSSAHSSTKLFGNLRHPIQLAEDTLKEAIDLKHSTDRLKNVESEVEVSGMYLRATLKFLLAASMFEVCDMGSATLGGKSQSTEIYIDTSKMLKQCAISFEHNGEIAAAALAYKCVEVAYMRVIFSMSSHIRRDGHELQASLHSHPFGQESSPLSALDVTNVREDGAPPGSEAKGVKPLASRAACSSPHLLNYAEYESSAMDAAQRSLSALKAAQWKYGLQGITAVKTALDFHFHDMDGFVRLVRLALEEIDI